MNKSRLSQILVIMLLFVPTLNFTFSSVEFNNKSHEEMIEPYTSNSWDLSGTRIHIDGNWSATASAHYWCSGNGTIDNPYIIENVTIDGGNDFGLKIANSREHFIVRNSKFVDISTDSQSYYNNVGILLDNVSNGQVINNNCSFNGVGIYAGGGYNNTIYRNHISNNNVGIITGGFFVTISENDIIHNSIGISGSGDGSEVQISSNNVSYNDEYGIYLDWGRNFSITKNVISNNHGKGIYLYENCVYNNISKNEISNNRDEGIYLTGRFDYGRYLRDCNHNWISDNKIANNSNGITLFITEGNQIINNILNYNQYSGISLYYSNLANIFNNTVNNNDIGINLANCISNDVVANTIDNSELVGIRLHYTDFTIISNNAVNNNYIGINLTNSKRNDMVANEINYNHFGIYFTDSRLNTVIQNTLLHNVKCFVEKGDFDYNTFEDNECQEREGLNVGVIISIAISAIGITILVVMFWLSKKRILKNKVLMGSNEM